MTALQAISEETLSRARRRISRLNVAVLSGIVSAALLAGCSAAPELDEAAGRRLQDRVSAAKQLTAQQNYTGAVAELDQLARELQTAVANGEVSAARSSRIEASVSKVRAGLDAAIAAAKPTPEPVPSTTAPAGGNDNAGGDDEDKDRGKGKGKGEEKQDAGSR